MLRRSYYAKRRGSALVMTILIVGVIASVAFSITALTLTEVRKASALQDSIGAYYTAEAGIEHGLMQYRLYHDAEISKELYNKIHANQTLTNTDSPTEVRGTPQNYRIDGVKNVDPLLDQQRPGFLLNNNLSQKGYAWYGLKMWYKGDRIGDVDASNNPVLGNNSKKILRDSALQLTIPNGTTQAVIAWEPDPTAASNSLRPETGFRYFIETIITSVADSELDRQIFSHLDRTRPTNIIRLDNIAGAKNLRIKPWDMSHMRYSIVFKDSSNNLVDFDNQISFIEATGYVGQAKRKLRIGINRATGTILESGDFLLLSGDSPIIIP